MPLPRLRDEQSKMAHPRDAIFQLMSIPRKRPLFMSIPSASRAIGIDPRRLAKAIAAGQIVAVRIGDQKMVPVAALERLAMGKDSGGKSGY